jgi:hypothetical protein
MSMSLEVARLKVYGAVHAVLGTVMVCMAVFFGVYGGVASNLTLPKIFIVASANDATSTFTETESVSGQYNPSARICVAASLMALYHLTEFAAIILPLKDFWMLGYAQLQFELWSRLNGKLGEYGYDPIRNWFFPIVIAYLQSIVAERLGMFIGTELAENTILVFIGLTLIFWVAEYIISMSHAARDQFITDDLASSARWFASMGLLVMASSWIFMYYYLVNFATSNFPAYSLVMAILVVIFEFMFYVAMMVKFFDAPWFSPMNFEILLFLLLDIITFTVSLTLVIGDAAV